MHTITPKYDLIIIGAGPAGLAAGIYAFRSGLKTVILEGRYPGGRLIEAHKIANYPGFSDPLSGYDLALQMTAQLEKLGGKINANEEAVSLSLEGETKTVITRKGQYTAKAVIIAIGVKRKRLLILGEKEFLGKGVSYCATCDGPLYKGQRVAVIGAGNEAFEEALFLSDLVARVILIPNAFELSAAESLVKNVRGKENTQLLEHSEIKSITGNAVLESIKVRDLDTNDVVDLKVNGVFIAVGVVPITNIIEKAGIVIDSKGWICVDRYQNTNISRVFAAGDCTGRGLQVATAVGEGAMAALSASRAIKTSKK